ncbi:hypothetical protein FXO38_15811 [Capsicum annuum]|nr:hypothetical protein FXO38_15811 [Capsicum annuum]KAF3676619.1 hypothetical protein FXO37_05218 [Capsicum annuum]
MSSASDMDSTSQMENADGTNWQEETYQKIKSMMVKHLPELNALYQKIASKVQQSHSSSATRVKGVRVTGDSTTEAAAAEIGDLIEMMQNLVTKVGHLAGKIEQFFSMEIIAPEDKVTISIQLEGEAIQWRVTFMRYRQVISWKKYVGALVERFGINFDDPMKEIKKIKQLITC